REAGIEATIFMPAETPMAKVEPTRNYGARAELIGVTFEDAVTAAVAHVEETGATFVHPFEDHGVIAGQGTIGLELIEQLPEVETVVIPVGGGGLASGIGLTLRALRPDLRLVGVQAAACAPLAGGTQFGYTIAEGIAVKYPGELTSRVVDDLLELRAPAPDGETSQAIGLLTERAKLGVEGPGAAAVAALLAGRVPGDGPTVAILSGGNIDPTLLIQVMRHGLTLAGRYLVVRTRIADRPGELAKLLALFADEHANVVSIEHHRDRLRDAAARLHRRPAALMLTCPTCGHENADGARFCSSCGTRLEQAAEPAREERKVVTVLFADLGGFPSRAEHLARGGGRPVLEPYHARLRTELERRGGTVEK